MRKALALLGLLLASSAFAAPPPYKVMSVGTFGGLNTDDPELTLGGDGQGRDQSPDSQNVVTDEGAGLGPRRGFTSVSTQTATAFWVLPHSNGSKYSIVLSSNNIRADTGDGVYEIQVSTVPVGQTVAGAALGDAFYFSDATNGIKKVTFSGTTPSVTVADSTIKATLLASHKGRLWASGISGDERAIRGSEYLDGTNFTLSILENPPETEPVYLTASGALDEPVRALFPYQDKLMFMKDHGFAGIYGSRRSNFIIKIFSEKSGTAYPESIQDCDGELRWLGPARTIWGWDGGVFSDKNLLSRDIDNFLATTAQGDANARSFTWTSESDFARGTNNLTSNVITSGNVLISTFGVTETSSTTFAAGTLTNISTYTTVGKIYIAPQSRLYDDFTDGTLTNPTWTQRAETTIGVDAGYSATGNRLRATRGASGTLGVLYATSTAVIGEWKFFYDRGTLSNNITQKLHFMASGFESATTTDPDYDDACEGYYLSYLQTSVSIRRSNNCATKAGDALVASKSGLGTLDDVTFRITRDSLGQTSLYVDGVFIASGTDTTYTSSVYLVVEPAIAGAGEYTEYDNLYNPPPTMSGTYVSQNYNTGLTSPKWLPTSYTSSAGAGTLSVGTQASSDGVVWDSSVAWTSGSSPASASKRHIRYTVDMVVSSTATSEPNLSDAELAARNSTGSWVSDSAATAGMTAHGVFTADDSLNSGTIAYAVYTDTDATKTVTNGVPVVGSFTSSQTITSGAIPSLSTAAYMFVGGAFAVSAATQAPALDAATINWGTGNALRVASSYINQRYWLAVSISSTANNAVLVYDRNREWQLYSGINANAMGIYNSNLYFGNTLGIWQGDTGTTDNGTAITSYYRTPAYIPSQDVDTGFKFNMLRVTTDNSADNLETSFRINGIETDYDLGDRLMNVADGFQNFALPFSSSEVRLGKYISFRFGVTGTTDWRILSANLYGIPDLEPR